MAVHIGVHIVSLLFIRPVSTYKKRFPFSIFRKDLGIEFIFCSPVHNHKREVKFN